ncbi:hypothetical protein FGO68_gene9997 [Halteria grandinella]|uniref:Uncharacterized protein n=1 Tax=Halteria grandinella TaxID=5974 RepID=A0A8J8P6V8_HALGN|nr:hypothetical protein FGO68_gene9997 [Halteria grandinella]
MRRCLISILCFCSSQSLSDQNELLPQSYSSSNRSSGTSSPPLLSLDELSSYYFESVTPDGQTRTDFVLNIFQNSPPLFLLREELEIGLLDSRVARSWLSFLAKSSEPSLSRFYSVIPIRLFLSVCKLSVSILRPPISGLIPRLLLMLL